MLSSSKTKGVYEEMEGYGVEFGEGATKESGCVEAANWFGSRFTLWSYEFMSNMTDMRWDNVVRCHSLSEDMPITIPALLKSGGDTLNLGT